MTQADATTAFGAFITKVEDNFQELEDNKANANHSHTGMLTTSDIQSSVSSSSTNAKPVGAKLFYDTIGNIETLLQGV